MLFVYGWTMKMNIELIPRKFKKVLLLMKLNMEKRILIIDTHQKKFKLMFSNSFDDKLSTGGELQVRINDKINKEMMAKYLWFKLFNKKPNNRNGNATIPSSIEKGNWNFIPITNNKIEIDIFNKLLLIVNRVFKKSLEKNSAGKKHNTNPYVL